MSLRIAINSLRSLKNRRKLWLMVHLYIGLSAGAVFVLIGLTGSLSVFWPELDTTLNPEFKQVQDFHPRMIYKSLDKIAAASQAVIPTQGKPYAFVFAGKPDEAFVITYSLPAKTPEQSEWHQVFINPYNARVIGQRLMFDTGNPWRGSLMNFFVRFHYTLALGETGRIFVGILALILLFSVLTGLLLWWPKSGKLKQALSIKRNASIERYNYDLHKCAGFCFSIALLVILFSGVYLVFTSYLSGLVEVFSPLKPDPGELISKPKEKQLPISLDQVAAITNKHFPDGEFKWIFFPQDQQGFYRIVKRAPQEINRTRPRRTLWLDQYSGKILFKQDLKSNSAGDIFLHWLYPLHNGEAFGLTGRIIILITGWVPLLLYATGVARWLQKRKAARLMRKKSA